jgi:ABC-2 type transport system permease protein
VRNIWIVVRHDVEVTLRQRSFWVIALLVPALLLAFNTFNAFRGDDMHGSGDSEADGDKTADSQSGGMPAIGLVDSADLIQGVPPGFPPDLFVPFPDQAAALQALEAGDVDQVVHIAADYLASGEVTAYERDFQIKLGDENVGVAFGGSSEPRLHELINYNLTGDEKLAILLGNPVPSTLTEQHAIMPPDDTGAQSGEFSEVVSRVIPYGYYFLLLMGGSYLMRSVVGEKENRTVEVLLLSLDPRQLMVGKILAMSVVLLVQLVFWVGGGLLLLDRAAIWLNAASFAFPPGFVVWASLFLVLGYLLFASVMAAAGAIAPNAREGAQVTWLLVLPLLPTLMFSSLFVEEPNHPLVLALSLFPFSAPAAMVTRLSVGTVPLWQALLSLIGLALTAYLFVVLAGRFFRAGNLLSDASFNWRRLASGWRKSGSR